MKMPKQGIQRLKIDDTGAKSSTKKTVVFKFNASAIEDHGKPGTNQQISKPLSNIISKNTGSKTLSKELRLDTKEESRIAKPFSFSQNHEGVPNQTFALFGFPDSTSKSRRNS